MKVKKRVLITGGNGYLGSELINSFYGKGYSVSVLSSSYKEDYSDKKIKEVFSFKLGDEINQSVFKGIDIFIHCAYDFGLVNSDESYDKNVLGSKKLFLAAINYGIHENIYISSISAFDECVSKYGNTKLQIESFASDYNFKILRPGVLFGGSNQGLIGSLSYIAQRAPLIPLVGKGLQVLYTIHVDDLASFIFKILDKEIIVNSPTVVASPKPYTLKQILINLSSDSMTKRKLFFIMIPPAFILYGLKSIEFLKINFSFRSDSLVSLLNTPKNVDFKVMKKINIKFKEL